MSYQEAINANKLAEELNSSYAYKFAYQMVCLGMTTIKSVCKEKNITIEELTQEDILVWFKEQEAQL